MWRINPKPIILIVCSMVCALYLWAQQPTATARELSSAAPATPHLPQPPHPPHISISPSPTNPMDTTPQPMLGGHRDGVVSVAFSPDGRLATGETDGMARIWDAQGRLVMTLKASDHGGEPIDRNRGYYPGYVRNVVFSPDGTKLATVDGTGTLRIWDSQGTVLAETQGWGMVFSPNSTVVAFITKEPNCVKLWNLQTRQWIEFRNSPEDTTALLGIVFSPDSSRLITYTVYNVKLWTIQGQLLADPEAINVTYANELRNVDNPWAALLGIFAVAFSPDGSKIAVLDYILDAQGQILGRLEQPEGWGYAPILLARPQFSPDSRKLIVMGGTNNPDISLGSVWNSQGQLLLTQFRASERGVSLAATFSPDSSRLATNASLREGDPVKLWDSQGEQLALIANLEGHQGTVSTMAFSPDSRLLAAIDDHNIRLWSRQGKLLRTFPRQHEKPVPTLQFSPDGRRLVSLGEDYTLRIWDVSGL